MMKRSISTPCLNVMMSASDVPMQLMHSRPTLEPYHLISGRIINREKAKVCSRENGQGKVIFYQFRAKVIESTCFLSSNSYRSKFMESDHPWDSPFFESYWLILYIQLILELLSFFLEIYGTWDRFQLLLLAECLVIIVQIFSLSLR